MSVYTNTRADLRQELARHMQDSWIGIATGGSTLTVVDTKLTQGNNFWRNAWVLLTSGTNNNGQIRQASGSTLSSNTVTFAPAVTDAVAAAATYELFKRFNPDIYHQALNEAVREVSDVALADVVDVSLTLAANTWEYTLPTGFRYIRRISYLEGTTDDTRTFIPGDLWYIRLASTRKIVFDGSLNFPAKTLMIEGQGAPAEMASDTATCPVHPNFVLAYARWYLHSILAGSDDEEAAYHERQMLIWERKYEERKATQTAHIYPGSFSVEPF